MIQFHFHFHPHLIHDSNHDSHFLFRLSGLKNVEIRCSVKRRNQEFERGIEIGIEKSHGLTLPGHQMLKLTLVPNSLQFLKNVSHPHTNFTKFATKIPSS